MAEERDATVQVILTRVSGENQTDPVSLYGKITATVDNSDKIIVLFEKSSSNAVSVERGKNIPLSNDTLSVKSTFTVTANLIDGGNTDTDNDIAKGDVKFPIQDDGTSKKHIHGTFGEITVKVTWTKDT